MIGVVPRAGTIDMVDDDAHCWGTLLAPNRMELCYLHQTPTTRIASCTEMTKTALIARGAEPRAPR